MIASAHDHLRPEVRRWFEGELDAARLISVARAALASTDALDEDFCDALRVLTLAFLHEARLNDAGLVRARTLLLRLVSNRLRIASDLETYPAIRAVPVVAPVFILGLPRTGTTLLHNLLACDPASRAPALWELECPSPPPDPRTRDTDPRIRVVDEYLESLSREAPELQELHPMASRAPDECNWLLLNSLHCGRLRLEYDIPSYAKVLTRPRLLRAYDLHRSQLQALTWLCPGERLVLKDPFHLWGLDALLETYPDARIIHTHRDPLRVLQSTIRLCSLARSLTSNDVRPRDVAQHWAKALHEGLACGLAARARRPDAFHDVLYADLVRDPVGEARRIYERFGLAWSDEVKARMQRWIDDGGHATRRAARYDDLSQLGLDVDALRAQSADYCERFGVE